MGTLSIYQQRGVKKLSAYVDHFDVDTIGLKLINPKFKQQFISTFCDHELADTNYAFISDCMRELNSDDYIHKLCMEDILKVLTYIIWTDKIVEGFFIAKAKDQTLYRLVHCLKFHTEAVLN